VLYPKAAQKMRDLLQSTGLSNTEFAGFLQLSSANLSGYLSGKVRPGYPALGYLEAVGGPTARDWLSEQEETELHSVFAQVQLSIEQSLEKTKEKLERLQNMAKKSA
jgi:transcriptional regulator with XRE-family HTH domain